MGVFMFRWWAFGASFLMMAASVNSAAQALTQKQRLADFDQLVGAVETLYGPYQFKQDKGILVFGDHVENFRTKVAETKTNLEFYGAIQEFVAGFKDGHFSVSLPSKRISKLGFSTDLIGGSVLISSIDRKVLSEEKFKFEIGDEVVSVDGVSALDLVDRYSKQIGSGNPLSVKRIASWMVARRPGRWGLFVDGKSAKVEIRRGQSQVVESIELDWQTTGDLIDENESLQPQSQGVSRLGSKVVGSYMMLVNESLLGHRDLVDDNFICSGKTRIEAPEGAEWILKEPISAFIFESEKGKIGFLRIPHYFPQPNPGETREAATQRWYEAYRFAVKKFEESTVGLIIDQDHNCGGSVTFVEDMMALFMNRPFKPMQFALRANKETYLDWKSWQNEEPAETLIYQAFKLMVDMLEKTWKTAPGSMTELVNFRGENTVYPDRQANYTKPIVMLIDEMAGSGGDAFPSNMKGEGRAKLFGMQTSGLGGSVMEIPSLTNSRLDVRLTRTLFFKPNGDPVENNGAIPDREYQITRDDVMYGYKTYLSKVTGYLLEQL